MLEIKQDLEKINEYLKQFLWMDFSFANINESEIKIIGSIDLSWEDYHSIEITFERPLAISAFLAAWSKPNGRCFIELATEKETRQKFDLVNNEQFVFKIYDDGCDIPCVWIMAQSIKYKIVKDCDNN